MLYDPKWENKTETKDEPETLEHLIEWLRQQNPNETYCYCDNGRCLLAQYYASLGYENVSVTDVYFRHDNLQEKKYLPDRFNCIAVVLPHTFGAALRRAEALL